MPFLVNVINFNGVTGLENKLQKVNQFTIKCLFFYYCGMRSYESFHTVGMIIHNRFWLKPISIDIL